jgi:hypothetical protein
MVVIVPGRQFASSMPWRGSLNVTCAGDASDIYSTLYRIACISTQGVDPGEQKVGYLESDVEKDWH